MRNVVKVSQSELIEAYGMKKTDIGMLLIIYGISYGLSKFVMGVISDKANPRYYIACGLIGSSFLTLALGTTHNLIIMGILMCILALFQGMGSPAAHKVIASWYHAKQRGIAFSMWNTSQNLGGALVAPIIVFATTFVTPVVGTFGIFFVPAVISLLLSLIIIIFGRDRPASVGLPAVEDWSGIKEVFVEKELDKNDRISTDGEIIELTALQIFIKYVVKNKYCWFLFWANAGVYLARYGISDWIPLYLQEAKGFDKSTAKYFVSLFELSAIPVTILIGVASDVLFKSRRAIIGAGLGVLNVALIFLYIYAQSPVLIGIIICLFGATVYGSLMLTATMTMELVPKFAVGALTGFIALAGYLVGEVCAGYVVPLIVGEGDVPNWTPAFSFVGFASILTVIFFVLLLPSEKQKVADFDK
ncbi:MAG: MFS transporter [Bifidobacteriaceae bacterium]|nr:MFS transporter [Bifidobacteriaceae bacterium]